MENSNAVGRSIKENVKSSISVSSIGALSYTYETKRSIYERIIWVIILIIILSLSCLQGFEIYNHYLKRPVIIAVDKAFLNWKLIFPTTTVCVQDFRNKKDLKPIFKQLIDKYNVSEDILVTEHDDFMNYLKDLAFKNYTNYEEYAKYATGEKKEYLKPEQYMEVLDRVIYTLDLDRTKGLRVKPGRMQVSPISFHMEKIKPVRRIFTEWGPCTVIDPNITMYYTPTYFNSTKFYSNYTPTEYTASDQTIMRISIPDKTMYVYHHVPNEIPDITSRKQEIKALTTTELTFESQSVFTSEDVIPLSVKQKNCRLPYEPEEEPLKHSPVYSYNLCKFECKIKIALKYCQCTPYYYRRLAHEPICNLTGLYCLSKYKDKLIYTSDEREQCLPCPQNCDVTMFQQVERTSTAFVLQTLYQMNLVFPNEIFERNLAFSKTDLTVQIGGTFGFFLGCSLLSFVEIIYCLTLWLLCSSRSQNRLQHTTITNHI